VRTPFFSFVFPLFQSEEHRFFRRWFSDFLEDVFGVHAAPAYSWGNSRSLSLTEVLMIR
jgi:hypothetical protein